ncbi:Glutaredoxin-C10 [Vitis vinifera]|uniref:Glutaredoxin-C10 n=1 Tax=Vitis vinifera TaxID=29760 RepID=A0A438GP54_VITVI|nr:Glutaredoxin-C10 [Vitis vinifera]
MGHVMKRLPSTIDVHPTVIEVDAEKIGALAAHSADSTSIAPAIFIDGTRVEGLESLVALHLSSHLVPRLAGGGSLLWG